MESFALCLLLEGSLPPQDGNHSAGYDVTNTSIFTNESMQQSALLDSNETDQSEASLSMTSSVEDVKHVLTSIVNPTFCIFGIVGNLFNILVLTRPRMQVTMDCTLEKSAQTGLISLAVSDMLYCVAALLTAFLGAPQVVFMSRDIWFYIQTLGPYVQNVFANTSTWLTVIMAAGRYAAICRPLHARYMVGVKQTRLIVGLIFVVWMLLQLPMVWTFHVVAIKCTTNTYYVLDHGPFVLNNKLKMSFSYLWSTVGFFIPVVVLAYCNVHLIRALRESRQMRKLYVYRFTPRSVSYGSKVTPTLVAIVCMFLVLVSPSEMLHFFYYHIPQQRVAAFTILLVIANTLLTINISLNFVLYCIVNAQFRQTLVGVALCVLRRRSHYRHHHHRRRFSSRASTNSTKGSLMIHSGHESFISGGTTPVCKGKTGISF